MKKEYYCESTKESNAEKTISMILRECRDLNALIKANIQYIPDRAKQPLLEDILNTLKSLNELNVK